MFFKTWNIVINLLRPIFELMCGVDGSRFAGKVQTKD